MGFTPTKICGSDTSYNRDMACINVGYNLRQVFAASSYVLVLKPATGDLFGVVDCKLDRPVSPEIVELVKKGLKEWGFDFPVIALPGGKGVRSFFWDSPSDYRTHMTLDL